MASTEHVPSSESSNQHSPTPPPSAPTDPPVLSTGGQNPSSMLAPTSEEQSLSQPTNRCLGFSYTPRRNSNGRSDEEAQIGCFGFRRSPRQSTSGGANAEAHPGCFSCLQPPGRAAASPGPRSSPRVTLGELLSTSPSTANQQVMQLVVEALSIMDQQPARANRTFPLIASYLLMIVSTLFGWTYDRGETRRLEKVKLKHLGLAAQIHGLMMLSVLCYMAGVLSGIYLIVKGTFGDGYMRRSKSSLILVWILVTSAIAAPAAVVSALVLGESYHVPVLTVIWFVVVCFGIEYARILTMSYLRAHQE